MEDTNPAGDGGDPGAGGERNADPPQRQDPQSSADDKRHKGYERIHWFVTGAASILATIATAIAAWYAVGAYEASLESVAEARKQVIAAREANEIERRTLAAAIGASVHVGPAEFRQLTQAGDETEVNILVPIGNDGGTTTRGLAYSATCAPTVTPAVNPYDHKVLDNRPVYNLTLPPKETIKPIICSYSIAEWAAIIAAKGSIYIYGRASYRDTIQPGERHKLEFCTRLDGVTYTASAFNPGLFAFGFECAEHNCSDDECAAQP